MTPMVRLGDVAQINPRFDKSSLADDVPVSFVQMASVGAADGKINVSIVRPFAEVKKGSYTPFKDGDVLFAKVTPCMENGKMAVARGLTNGVGFGSSEFHVLRPSDQLDAKYLYYFVSSQAFRKEAAGHMTGAVGLRRVPAAFLADATLRLVPLDEQRRIVAEIEQQFSRLDEAVANLQRVKANLKRYKASVLKAAVEGLLTGDNYESFNRVRLGDIVALNPRLPKDSLDDSTKVSFVPMAAVGADDGSLDLSASRCYSEVRKGYTNFANGDVLFAKVTPCMENGKISVATGLLGGYGFGSTEFHVLRARDGIDPEYVHCLVSSQSFRKEAARHMTGAVGLRRVPTSFLETVEVSVPPLNIQRFIVAEVNRHLSIVREVEAGVNANIRHSISLRSAVLADSFQINY